MNHFMCSEPIIRYDLNGQYFCCLLALRDFVENGAHKIFNVFQITIKFPLKFSLSNYLNSENYGLNCQDQFRIFEFLIWRSFLQFSSIKSHPHHFPFILISFDSFPLNPVCKFVFACPD